jgi:hypothetical protein
LRYDPIKFVFKHGDEVTQLHLLQFLGLLENKKGKDLILHLLKSQMPSGGFPSKFDEKTEGIRETCRNALLLLNCGIPHDGLNIQSAVNYLVKHQHKNGGWSENPNLTIPKHVVELSKTKSITWLTADIIELLRRIRLEKSEPCTRALNWLRKMQYPDGGWPMFKRDQFRVDPDSTAQILFLMKEIYGEKDKLWIKGIKLFEKFLDKLALDAERGYYIAPTGEKRENDIYHLTHLLIASLVDSKRRVDAGYNLKDVRVKKIIQAILKSQREDGGWRPFWTQNSDPIYTVLTLKLLLWLDTLKPESLRKHVAPYL